LLNPEQAAFVVSKNASNEVKRLQNNGSGRPRLVAVVCSLKSFGNNLIFWQLISVKARKSLPYLPLQPTGGKRLAVSTFWDLSFPPKLPGNRRYRHGDTTP